MLFTRRTQAIISHLCVDPGPTVAVDGTTQQWSTVQATTVWFNASDVVIKVCVLCHSILCVSTEHLVGLYRDKWVFAAKIAIFLVFSLV